MISEKQKRWYIRISGQRRGNALDAANHILSCKTRTISVKYDKERSCVR